MLNNVCINDMSSIRDEYEEGHLELTEEQVDELADIAMELSMKNGCLVDNEEEVMVYNLLKDVLLPTLNDYVRLNNPEAYEVYQGNMCRHASLVACHTLKRALPDWDWNIYEVKYSATLYEKDYTCTHAFVIGERRDEFRVVDMWDALGLKLYAPIDSIRYPFEYDVVEKNRKIISFNQMSYHDMSLLENELLLGNVPELLKNLDGCIDISRALGMLR